MTGFTEKLKMTKNNFLFIYFKNIMYNFVHNKKFLKYFEYDIFLFLFLITFTHILDILSTYVFLSFGFTEGNPLMVYMFNQSNFYLTGYITTIFLLLWMTTLLKIAQSNVLLLKGTYYGFIFAIFFQVFISLGNSIATIIVLFF